MPSLPRSLAIVSEYVKLPLQTLCTTLLAEQVEIIATISSIALNSWTGLLQPKKLSKSL